MIKSETKTIGDHEYLVNQWPATQAMVTKLKVVKYLGKALSAFSHSKDADFAEVIMGAISETLTDINPEEFIEFLKEIACTAIRDGERMKKVQFDSYFQENFVEAYELVVFILKVNYEDFLGYVLNLQKGA